MSLKAHFLNQGRVDSVLLECDGEYCFIDGGYRRNGLKAVEYMRKLGVTRLKYYVASHGHKNHIGAAAAIIGAIPTDAIVAGRAAVLEAIRRYAKTPEEAEAIDECDINVLTKGDKLTLGGAVITCVGPAKQAKCSCGAYSENYNSLILRVDDYMSMQPHRLLLTGDSTAAIIAKCGKAARAWALKSPHHAGTQPESLINQVDPYVAIICSNVKAGATYRKRLARCGAKVLNVCAGDKVINLL